MVDVSIVWDDVALAAYAARGVQPRMAMDVIAGKIQVAQKAACPVAPVYPVSGATVRGGTRRKGDFPLRPSGKMRSSIVRVTEVATGDILIGPTDPAAKYVLFGTEPHEIRSHGDYPLRNRATGQTFGPLVHHPGTRANNFVLKGLEIVKGVTLHVS